MVTRGTGQADSARTRVKLSVAAGKAGRFGRHEGPGNLALWNVPNVPRECGSWSVSPRGDLIEIGFGRDKSFPQYAAIHADSSFLRLNSGPGSDWGTSIILLPSFWEHGRYHQGAPTTVRWFSEGSILRVSFGATISGLRVRGEIVLAAPSLNEMSGDVAVQIHGSVDLDDRAGEAFKPVMLSSMHVSDQLWDVHSIVVDANRFDIPDSGWIVRPGQLGRRIVLVGGKSGWKKQAPGIEIELDRPLKVAGWKGSSCNPNDDNVGFWAAADSVLPSWHYAITVTSDRPQ
jgi:hypothetical protein